MQTYEQDQLIFQIGMPNNTFHVIADGTVDARVGSQNYPLKKGDIVGILDITSPEHTCAYVASSDVSLMPYPFGDTKGLIAMMNKQEDLRKLMVNSINRNICGIIATYSEDYKKCMELHKYLTDLQQQYHDTAGRLHLTPKTLPFIEELEEFSFDEEMPFWMSDFYSSIRKIVKESSPSMSTGLVYGYLERSGRDIANILSLETELKNAMETFSSYLLNEDYLDFYDL